MPVYQKQLTVDNCFGLKGMDERKMLVLISRLGRIVQIQKVCDLICFVFLLTVFQLNFCFGVVKMAYVCYAS